MRQARRRDPVPEAVPRRGRVARAAGWAAAVLVVAHAVQADVWLGLGRGEVTGRARLRGLERDRLRGLAHPERLMLYVEPAEGRSGDSAREWVFSLIRPAAVDQFRSLAAVRVAAEGPRSSAERIPTALRRRVGQGRPSVKTGVAASEGGVLCRVRYAGLGRRVVYAVASPAPAGT